MDPVVASSAPEPDKEKTEPRIYLAGPEVFLADALEIGAAKKRLCAARGFVGVMPLDNELDLSRATAAEAGLAIYQANLDAMGACDLLIANMTPFRSPSADPGTAFEMGYMRGLGKPVFAYSNAAGGLVERTTAFIGAEQLEQRSDGTLADLLGMTVESFGLTDNLMLDGAVCDTDSAGVVTAERDAADPFRDLTQFEACLARAAAILL